MPVPTTTSPNPSAFRSCRPGSGPNSGAPLLLRKNASVIALGDFAIDIPQHRVTVRGADVHLTPKQFDLLVYLAQHTGRVLTHRTLLKAIWGTNANQPEYLRVSIGQLRKKIETSDEPRYIVTEPWVGYRFRPTGDDE